MRLEPLPARPAGAPRRLVVATPVDPQDGEELSRVSWPRTVLRLALQPAQHPWRPGWRLARRGPLLALAAAVAALLFFAASGCASGPLTSVAQSAQVPAPPSGARCESILVSRELSLPLQGDLGEVRLTLRDIPEASGKLRVLVRQPRFPGALDLDALGTTAFDKVQEVPAMRELTLVLSRPRKAPDDWPRSSCKVCRVEVELTGLFGAREGLGAFMARAMEEAAAVDGAFARQASGRPEHPSALLRDLGARLTAEGRRCGVALDPAVSAVESALAQLDAVRAAFYDAEVPRVPDATLSLGAWEAASAALQQVPAASAAARAAGWPLSLRIAAAGSLRSAALHLDLAAQANALEAQDRDAAARFIALATAPDAAAMARRTAELPRIRDLQDARARLAWVDPPPRAVLPLPGTAASLRVAWFSSAPHGRKCIGSLGAAPVRDPAADAAAVAVFFGADSRARLRLSRGSDLAAARETLRRAREILCEPIEVDVEALFSGLEERELGLVSERLAAIFAQADPRRENDELARAVSARTARLLCRLLSQETVDKRVTSVAAYKIFVEGGTHIADFLPGPLICEGRGVALREVRRRLRDAYRAALDKHAVADRLCPLRGNKCPEEVAASVRRLFGLQRPDLAAPAGATGRALDFPPPFGFSDAWVHKLDRCGREACDALSRLRSEAPEGQFEGSLCAPPDPFADQIQDVTLDRPDAPTSVTLSSCDAHAGVRLTLRRRPEAGTLVSIASAHQFRYGSENVTRQGRHPQLGRIFERVADLGDGADVVRRPDGAFEVALTPTVDNQVFWFFSLRRRDY